MIIKNKINLVLLASGLASRVHDIHQGLYPKVLMNLGPRTILDNILDQDYGSITIIVNSKRASQQIKQYLSIVKYDISKVKFLIKDVSLSTAHTLKYFQSDLPKENILIHWSDIYVNNKINVVDSKINIFTDTKYKHRLNFDGTKIHESDSGNICGIYYLPNLDIFDEVSLNELEDKDFDYIISKSNNLISNPVSIVDTGDMVKYAESLRDLGEEVNGRFFNDIKFEGEYVIKKSLTPQGNKLLFNEFNFYSEFQHLDLFPNIRTYSHIENKMKMERLDGVTVFQSKLKDLLPEFIKTISKLHNSLEHKELKFEDVYLEYYETTKSRYQSIHSILPKINRVNDIDIPNINQIFKDLQNFVTIYYKHNKVAKPIHGDPNTSNVMVTKEGLKFIDPRGYFGKSRIYGDPNYDIAKFIYGLTGYDEFNKFELDIQNKNNSFKYENNNIIIAEYGEYIEDIELQMLIAIIWMKLPAYTINNINKSIISWANGLRLFYKNYNKYLNKYDK